MEENNLGCFLRNSIESLIAGVKAEDTMKFNDTVNKRVSKQSWVREKKELWKNKVIHEQFANARNTRNNR